MTLWDLYRTGRWQKPSETPAPVVSFEAPPRIKTEFANTIFSGEPREWVRYLNSPREQRFVQGIQISILWDSASQLLLFRPETSDSAPLAQAINTAYKFIEADAREKSFVGEVFDDLVFGNTTNGIAPLNLYLSAILPCETTREVRFDDQLTPVENNIVVNSATARGFMEDVANVLDGDNRHRLIGASWPLLQGILAKLARSSVPRDEFVERIEVTAKLCVLTINTLFKGAAKRNLVPNKAGEIVERYYSRRDGVELERLYERHPLFRLLNELRFFIDDKGYRNHMDAARVLVREYLDQRYLRLSLAGVMPDPAPAMQPMGWSWVKKRKIATPPPQLGRYGIQDNEDLAAWKKVDGPFDDMGYTLIRQLGIGQFGRVYEAVNRENPHIPQLVALKVDRIQPGDKKQAIRDAENTLLTAGDLALSPHVIRIYDAGKLSGKKYTYHILERVDGETLDHLAGVAGSEHASFHGARGRHANPFLAASYGEALDASAGEVWRAGRLATSFTDPLSLSQCLDLITSMLLWVEEIHQIGYAINDLKNGNLMVSRRGQLKGIDLDSYEPAMLPAQRTPDFVFLAVTLVLLLLNIRRPGAQPFSTDNHLTRDYQELRKVLNSEWAFGDVALISGGRVRRSDILDLLVELLEGCRDHRFAHDPDGFSEFIDRFIWLKRLTFLDEIVLD